LTCIVRPHCGKFIDNLFPKPELIKLGNLYPINWSSDGEWIYAIYFERPNEIVKILVRDRKEIHFYTLAFGANAEEGREIIEII